MRPLPGLSHNYGLFCCLCRTLYGLKQPPHSWYERLQSIALQIGFKPSIYVWDLFIRRTVTRLMILLQIAHQVLYFRWCLLWLALILLMQSRWLVHLCPLLLKIGMLSIFLCYISCTIYPCSTHSTHWTALLLPALKSLYYLSMFLHFKSDSSGLCWCWLHRWHRWSEINIVPVFFFVIHSVPGKARNNRLLLGLLRKLNIVLCL